MKINDNNKLVLRILPNEMVMSTALTVEQFKIDTDVIRWPLPKRINPNQINDDLEFLITHLEQLTKKYGLEGSQVTLILPHSVLGLKNLDIPLNLSVRADKNEYKTLNKSPYEFWKEYDENLVDFKEAEIRADYLFSNPSDGSSKMLYGAANAKSIKDYISLALGGNLYPISLIAEDQAILKIVDSRLGRLERERPICIFHLSKGNNRLLYCSNEQIQTAKVDISELDETVLDDAPDFNEINNSFWDEISGRLSTALKQSTIFLKEELKVSKFDTIYFVTDYKNESSLFKLFHKNFRIANFRSLVTQFYIHPKDKATEKNYFVKSTKNEKEASYNASIIIPNCGAYELTYFNTPSIPNKIIETKLFNFHPNFNFVENNFKYYQPFKKFMFIALPTLFFLGLVDVYLNLIETKTSISLQSEFTSLESSFNEKSTILSDIQLRNKTANTKLTKLDELLSRQNNQAIHEIIREKLPKDIELDRVQINQKRFFIEGHSKNVSDVNLFHEKLLQVGHSDLSLKIYKRADKNLNYFQIIGGLAR